jgi:RimJ/RimL family protein N-acetyltransferase
MWIAIVPDGLDRGGDLTQREFGAGQAVGYIELHILDAESGCAEIGYGLHPDAWGRGLATRIAVAAVNYAFNALHLHRVEATCDARNVASMAVLRKVGMRHEGRLRENVRLRDGWRDSEVFGVLAHEWVPPAASIAPR